MNQDILKILENGRIIFNSNEIYNKFQLSVLQNKFQEARYFLDIEMEQSNQLNEVNDNIFHLYSDTEDMLMNLVINEIDGEEERNKPINKNIRSL